MWHLYILMGMLAAGILVKIVHPLLGKGRHKHGEALTKNDRVFVYSLVAALPVLSIGIYLMLGEPDLPGAPATLMDYQEIPMRHAALLSVKPFKILVEKDPHNVGALSSLAQANYRIKNYEQAILFFRKAADEAEVQQDLSFRPLLVTLGEVQVEANNGAVNKDALETFGRVIAIYPESPIARYYIALWKAQEGKYEEAITEWTALLEGGYPEIYWKRRVREKIAETRKKLP